MTRVEERLELELGIATRARELSWRLQREASPTPNVREAKVTVGTHAHR
jgi:hypothetical protein